MYNTRAANTYSRASSYQWNYNGYQGDMAQIWNEPAAPYSQQRRTFNENTQVQRIWSESSDSLLSLAKRDSICMVAKQLKTTVSMNKMDRPDSLKGYLCIAHIQDGYCAQGEFCNMAHNVLELGKPIREKTRSNSNTSDYHSDGNDTHKKSLSPRSNSSS
ncbi:unnamed protein product [Bursaphelenchus okinawaensis]|uniref:C3H1-type domain-containing protein n=1 Tax=Bursaphelenchus okinawaensis TaxID=465554 RepID=A0A811L8W5_9BILA|nr:unnamed protein product [Bursaphelenchus okinawaensis]CAG9119715.1 unnamed protein product [Bursaphelenchus okinawaensis]